LQHSAPDRIQLGSSLFTSMMLCTDTLWSRAILIQVSPPTTVYEMGGSRVGVGTGVSVAVGGRLKVGSGVRVAVSVGVLGLLNLVKAPEAANAMPIPAISSTAKIAINKGRGNVTRGTESERLRAEPDAAPRPIGPRERSAPHTRHFVAAAPTRVPQVGHRRGPEAVEADDFAISHTRRAKSPGECGHYTIAQTWQSTT